MFLPDAEPEPSDLSSSLLESKDVMDDENFTNNKTSSRPFQDQRKSTAADSRSPAAGAKVHPPGK